MKYNVIVDKLGLSDWGSQLYLLRQAGVDERRRRLSHIVQEEEI